MEFTLQEGHILRISIVLLFLFIWLVLQSIQKDKAIRAVFFLLPAVVSLEPILYIVCSDNIIKNIVLLTMLYSVLVFLILKHYYKKKKEVNLQMLFIEEPLPKNNKKIQKERNKRLRQREKRKKKRFAETQRQKRKEERQKEMSLKTPKTSNKQRHKHDKK